METTALFYLFIHKKTSFHLHSKFSEKNGHQAEKIKKKTNDIIFLEHIIEFKKCNKKIKGY